MNAEPYDDEISLGELWDLLVRGLPFAVIITVLAAFTTFMLVRQAPRVYEATATIMASQPDAGLKSFNVSLVTAPPVNAPEYEAAAKGFPVLTRALKSLGKASPSRSQVDGLRQNLSITAEQDSNSSLIHIRVRDQTPTTASDEANAVAASLLTWDKNRASSHLNTIIETLQGQIKSLDAQIAAAKAGGDTSPTDVSGLAQLKAQQTLQLNAAQALSHSAVGRLEIVTPAQTPLRPVEPRPKLAAMIAALLALLAAYLVTFLRSALDSRYHSVDDLGRDLGLTVLGEFPTLRQNASLLPREPVNFLRTNLSFVMTAMHPKVMLVTSAESGDGKTTLAMNLAEAYARNDYRTLLIDADLRKPDVGRMLGFEPEGAWNLLELLRKPQLEMTLRTIDVDGVTFDVLPTGMESSRATELLSRGFKQILERIHGYDVIVIDSAPILPVADSLVIAPHANGVVLTSNLVDTDKRRIRSAVGLLERLGVQITGLAVTHVPEQTARRKGSGSGYGYGYGYGYGGSTRSDGRERPQGRVASVIRRRSGSASGTTSSGDANSEVAGP